jgi:hypothetical protein
LSDSIFLKDANKRHRSFSDRAVRSSELSFKTFPVSGYVAHVTMRGRLDSDPYEVWRSGYEHNFEKANDLNKPEQNASRPLQVKYLAASVQSVAEVVKLIDAKEVTRLSLAAKARH